MRHREHRPPWRLPCCAALLLLTCLQIPATAEVHRTRDAQTGWWWLYNVTPADVDEFLRDHDARIIDIEIHQASPLRLTVAFVQNTGVYASGWWWYYGLEFADIGTYINDNNARLIDIERYVVGGQERWAVVMIPNTGAQQKAWWWYVGQREIDIERLVGSNNARLVDLESYDTSLGRRYAAIMIANTGADATPWAWFYNTDLATITTYMNNNNMRLLEFQVRNAATPTFDAVLVSLNHHTPRTWWWYFGVTADQLPNLYNQAASRIVDIDTYLVGDQRRYSVVLLNNANDLTIAAASALQWGSDGWTGAYLKEAGGVTLASLQPDFTFEPASTIKAIHHLHALRMVQAGQSNLAQPVTYSENYSGSCPIGGAPFTTQTLQETLRRMMVNSDNAATEGIAQLYSPLAIQNTAQIVAGMTETELNHTIGCGAAAIADPNVLTLRNTGRLYERIQALTILDEPRRTIYYNLMQNENTPNPWWFTVQLRNLIYSTASDLGLPTSVADNYWDATELAWKPGGYGLNNLAYTSVGGIVLLPRCGGGPGEPPHELVFGSFVHGAGGGDSLARIQAALTVLFQDLITTELQACPTSVEDMPVARTQFQPPYPNPFNPATELSFSLERDSSVRLSVFDAAGREVAVLVDGQQQAGRHQVTWAGRDGHGRPVAAGIYIARLVAGDLVESHKMALIK